MGEQEEKSEPGPWEAIAETLPASAASRVSLDTAFHKASRETVDLFLEEVDQSDYSIDDWAGALGVFEQWLLDRKIESRPLPEMIGYIHCCTLTNAPGIPLPSLKVIVSQALTEFGFEIVSKSQL